MVERAASERSNTAPVLALDSLRSGIALALVAAALTLLAWPAPFAFIPATDDPYRDWVVDLSWEMALHLSAIEGFRWGRDIVFTYGPLAFFWRVRC